MTEDCSKPPGQQRRSNARRINSAAFSVARSGGYWRTVPTSVLAYFLNCFKLANLTKNGYLKSTQKMGKRLEASLPTKVIVCSDVKLLLHVIGPVAFANCRLHARALVTRLVVPQELCHIQQRWL